MVGAARDAAKETGIRGELGGFPLWLSVGNLNNGGTAGLSCVNGNNGLGNARWNIASRLSGCRAERPRHESSRRVYRPPSGASRFNPAPQGVKSPTGQWAGSTCERSYGIQKGRRLKTYCKGLRLHRAAIEAGYADWLQAPAGRKNRWRVKEEYGTADALIDEIATEIAERRLTFRPIHRYDTVERGKHRRIGVESVKQQVVDHAAIVAMEPLLKAKVGFWQCGTNGKGQEAAASHTRAKVREGWWHVHMDVRRCYPSARHDVVLGILRRYVASADVIYACGALLSTYTEGGMEIGSYFSLRVMQLVLSFGYHHVESLGRRRRGKWVPLVRGQIWYADDAWLWGPRKADVQRAARSLERFTASELGLEVKPWQVCRFTADEPMDVCGYRVFPDRVRLRGKTFIHARRQFREFEEGPTETRARRVVSHAGRLRHASSFRWFSRGWLNTKRRARALVSERDRSKNGGHTDDKHDRTG